MRIVPFQDTVQLVSFAESIPAVREAWRDYGEYPETRMTRNRAYGQPSGDVRVSVFPGITERAGAAGAFVRTNDMATNTAVDEERSRTSFSVPVTPLYDPETAELLAVFVGKIEPKHLPGGPDPGGTGSVLRTASQTAVGFDEVAKADASDVAVLGSGNQARGHLMAVSELRDVERARVYSPTRAHREAFAEEMADVVPATIEAVEDTAAAIRGADVVLCATNASEPVFDGVLLEAGQTVVSVVGSDNLFVQAGHGADRRREIDDRTVERADLVVAASPRQAREYEQGDLYLPVQRGIIGWDDVVSQADVVAGGHPGRESDDQIVLLKNTGGEGISDLAIARVAWELARDRDLGVEVDVHNPLHTEG